VSQLAPGRNLVLVGLMGTGKSTVGRIVAQRLQRKFVDTDRLIESEQGKPVAQIFSEDGERAFRELEAEAVRRVSATRGQVISVGGGAVMDPANVRHLKATGDVMLLRTELEQLAQRVGGANLPKRPLLAGDDQDVRARLASLWDERRDAYMAAADTTVDTTARPIGDVVEEVMSWLAARPGALAPTELSEEKSREELA